MTGYVEWSGEPGRGRIACCDRKIFDVRFCAAAICRTERTPEFLIRRRLAGAARVLRRCGVSTAVFPEPFAYAQIFMRRGIFPVEVCPLLRALAPELVQSAVKNRGLDMRTAIIAVCGERITSELAWTATRLCRQSRYVLLAAPDPDGAFCRRIRREYGAALVQTKDSGRIAGADVCVQFSPECGPCPGGVVLPLYRGAVLPPIRLRLREGEERLMGVCNRMQVLAALYAEGAVRPEQIAAEILPKVPEVGGTA